MNTNKIRIALVLLLSVKAQADSVSLGVIGLTSHGMNSANDKSYTHMPRKVSRAGLTVWNPELNLTWEHSGYLFNATYVSDCMAQDAYYLGAGYRWNISENFSASILGGIYFRKDPQFKEDFKRIDGYKNQIVFAPWISLERDFKISGGVHAFVNLSSNVALTHAVTGIKYKY